MSIERICCYTLACDDCATPADIDNTDIGYLLHFDTDQQALDWAADHSWQITEDGHIRCPRCAAQHLCGTYGHLHTPWQPCPCRGQHPTHQNTGCPLVRVCEMCGQHDTATLAQLPTYVRPQ